VARSNHRLRMVDNNSALCSHFARGKSLLDERTRISERNVRGWPVRSLLLDSIPFARAHLQFLQLNRDCTKFSLEASRILEADRFSCRDNSNLLLTIARCSIDPGFLSFLSQRDASECEISRMNRCSYREPEKKTSARLESRMQMRTGEGISRGRRLSMRLSEKTSCCSIRIAGSRALWFPAEFVFQDHCLVCQRDSPSAPWPAYIIRDFRIQEKKLRENASENEAIL